MPKHPRRLIDSYEEHSPIGVSESLSVFSYSSISSLPPESPGIPRCMRRLPDEPVNQGGKRGTHTLDFHRRRAIRNYANVREKQRKRRRLLRRLLKHLATISDETLKDIIFDLNNGATNSGYEKSNDTLSGSSSRSVTGSSELDLTPLKMSDLKSCYSHGTGSSYTSATSAQSLTEEGTQDESDIDEIKPYSVSTTPPKRRHPGEGPNEQSPEKKRKTLVDLLRLLFPED